MKFEDLAETCGLEIKARNCEADENLNIINGIADKVEQVITAKLEEFNKSVNTAEDNKPINNNGDNAGNNDNTGDSSGNNESANSSAEQE